MKNIRIFDVFKSLLLVFLIAGLFFIIVGITKAQTSCGGPNQPVCSGTPSSSGSYTPSSGSYSMDPAVGCSQAGGTWNSSMNYCQMPGTTSPSTGTSGPYPSSGCGGPGQPACSGSYTGTSGPYYGPSTGTSGPYPSSGCGGPNQPACSSSYSTTYPATSYSSTNNNWVRHVWQFTDGSESSYILNRTDQEYQDFISKTHAQCVLAPRSKFSWKPNAGDDSSGNWRNFGIPDCPLSSSSTTGPQPMPVTQQQTQTQQQPISQPQISSITIPSNLTKCVGEAFGLSASEVQRQASNGQIPAEKLKWSIENCSTRTESTKPQQPNTIQQMPRGPEQQPYQGETCSIKDIQRGAKQMEKEIKNLSKRIEKFTKRGMTVSQEIQSSIKDISNIVTALKSITKCDEMNDIDQQSVPELMQIVNEGLNTLERLNQFPRMLKQGRSDIKRMERQYKSLLTKAKRSTINISSVLERIKSDIDNLKTYLSNAEASYKIAEAEEVDGYMQDFFQNTQAVWEDINQVESVFNLSKFVKDAQKNIKNSEREIRTFKRQKMNTADMEAAVAEGKNWIAEIQNLLKAGISSIEDAMELMDRGNEIRQQYEEARQEAMNSKNGTTETKKQYPFLQQFLPRLTIPQNLLKALVR